MGVILDARQELFLTSLYIQLFYNNYLRGRIGSMFKRYAQEKDRVTLCVHAYTYAPFPKSHVYRVNNKTFFYYVLPKTRAFSAC